MARRVLKRAGWASEPAGRASDGNGLASDPAGGPRSQLGGPQSLEVGLQGGGGQKKERERSVSSMRWYHRISSPTGPLR